ncbi:MAG TPA: ABC transporter permease [Acidimicrobiales bacterium]|nr:ABC transporter permease [Acidimicrobiales bacterium]
MIRLERRVETPRWLDVAVPLASFVAALVVGGLVLQLTGHSALGTYERIVERALTSDGALSGTLVAATPLLFTGLAAAVAFRMNVFNIGGEGQLVLGAIAASGAGLALEGRPGWLIIGAMVVAGAAAGAAWAAIPGALRAFTGTNEIITSLMLNYVAANLATYLIFGSRSFWRSLEGSGATFPTGKRLPPEASWPSLELGGVVVPFGFLLGVAGAVVLLVVLRATRFGFAMRVVADAPAAARYAGIRGRRVVLGVMALSGAAAGIGGASNIGDTRHVLDPRGLNQAGYGYAGIVVAALARLNPVAVVFVSIVMGGLANAGRALQGPDFPAGLVGTLQGLLLVFTLGGEVFARYRIRRARTVHEAHAGAPPPPTAEVTA